MESKVEKLGYEPETRAVQPAKEEAGTLSGRILEILAIKTGKATEPGPAADICEAVDPDFKEFFVIRHPWSIYGAGDDEMKKGMERLRAELPKNGWKITKDGKAPTKDQDPEIFAVDNKNQHKLHAIWHRAATSKKPLIAVTVVSKCYRAPEGTDLSAES